MRNRKRRAANDYDEDGQLIEKVGFNEAGGYDEHVYGGSGNDAYVKSIAVASDDEEDEDEIGVRAAKQRHIEPRKFLEEAAKDNDDVDPMAPTRARTIAERQNDYQSRARARPMSPERADPFLDQTPQHGQRSYADVMKEKQYFEDKQQVEKEMVDKYKSGELREEPPAATPSGGQRKRIGISSVSAKVAPDAQTPHFDRWEETPMNLQPGDATPTHIGNGASTATPSRNRWDDASGTLAPGAVTPQWTNPDADDDFESKADASARRRSRWDLTPSAETPRSFDFTPKIEAGGATPSYTMTPGGATPIGPIAMGLKTPAHITVPGTPEQIALQRHQMDIELRNQPITDEELDSLFPPGYKIWAPPASYIPLRTPSRKLFATPTPMHGSAHGFSMQATPARGQGTDQGLAAILDTQPKDKELPALKPEDMQYFDKLLMDVDESLLSKQEKAEREIMGYLLKIKNGTPQQRKAGLRKITENSRRLGAGPLFHQILPLLMSPTLEDQERHLLVKVIDRVLYKLDDLVRPYVHKILVVIEPLLIDEDYYARVEGREIISNLAKAAGLATMISTMRPDIDNVDEYVRNTTARAFAVVASSLGIPALLPFLKAVCKSKKSWQARHTGIKIVQQIAILMGCAILPYLKQLVEIVENGLTDDQQKVRTMTALCISALAEASAPYGIEAFDSILKPLWKGIRSHRGKGLAAQLKAVGYLIPLMDAEYASYYTKEVMLILIREFISPDEEMKKIVLKVVKQCCSTDGVEPEYVRDEILGPFFKAFWNHRMAMDRRNYKQLVDTTVEIAQKVGGVVIIQKIVEDLKDENEQYRKMVMETIDNVITLMGTTDIDDRLEELLFDGILYAFQEQSQDEAVMLNGFGTVCNGFGKRAKVYLPQICGTILWRLNNKTAKVRQQAADLISKIAPVMGICKEDKLLCHLGVVLFEYLGEEYPEVLGSIIGALKAVVEVVGMTKMTPPIKDLLPRLTPILKNRHEKVQENTIELVGRIADRGSEFVSAREWMRICFELLDLLKAHRKSIRRAAINTFGYIAKAIGPHDVLATLLNNLKVQERQLRVCTTVAIAIVAETCAPFTVLPAIMNEYRVPEINVQNGVLKALSFLFEYVGEMAKDYIYAVTPLLIDALQERDIVHRQIAIDATAHLTLGVYGFGCEDALVHLFNHVWPNLLEISPHVIQRFIFASDAMRVAIGPIKVMQYCLQGLFHPARKVRDPCWKVYNNLILGSQDALVAGYPRIQNTETNHFVRDDLDIVL
uniref:Splicing factor 3B subunit 1 domain-containing protein n=1 Tax=Panagrolaimus superbus TaxID=310955 RepID=A0A914ZAI7_9BILA